MGHAFCHVMRRDNTKTAWTASHAKPGRFENRLFAPPDIEEKCALIFRPRGQCGKAVNFQRTEHLPRQSCKIGAAQIATDFQIAADFPA